MPFTISHMVAVLPLTRGRVGRVLVPAALAIGSMVPDLPYFVPPHVGAAWSHSALGPVTTDLVFGLVLYAVWHVLLVRPLTDLSPRWLRVRLPDRRRLGSTGWLSAACSVVIGSITHVVWDTFTHRDRWGTRHVGWLAQDLGGLPGFKWLQFGSGLVGLLVLIGWVAYGLSRTPPHAVTAVGTTGRTRAVCWAVTVVAFVAAFVATWWSGGHRVDGPDGLDEVLAVKMVTQTIAVTVATVLVLCLVWQARRARSA